MDPVRNLNNLLRGNKQGLHKQWIWRDSNFSLGMGYLQKMNYSIQDINETISLGKYDFKSIVFLIACVDWIRSSYRNIESLLLGGITDDFVFSKKNDLEEYRRYLDAMRSFVIAHPLNTNRHREYSLDGDFICIDVRSSDAVSYLFLKQEDIYHIDVHGMKKGGNANEALFLYSYSQNINKSRYATLIGFRIEDLVDSARLYIDATYELDRFLANKKKIRRTA